MDHQARLIFGAHPFGQWDEVKQREFLHTLQVHGIKDIDTVIGYVHNTPREQLQAQADDKNI
jgi:hypothetical protein